MNMNLQNITELLVSIEKNPELKAFALSQCESLYEELFKTTYISSGQEIIDSLTVNCNNSSLYPLHVLVDSYVNDVFYYEKFMSLAIAQSSTPEEAIQKYFEIKNSYDFEYDQGMPFSEFDHYLEKMKSYQWVELVNYKGEGESECLLIDASHLRTYHGKYSYD